MIHKDIPKWAWRGWETELESGKIIREGECDWKSIPIKEIIRLSLLFDGRRWDLKGKRNYFQKKRGSAPLFTFNMYDFTVESRTIGYYDEKGQKVCYTVDEHTGNFKLEIL
jgi:hypothetical protein